MTRRLSRDPDPGQRPLAALPVAEIARLVGGELVGDGTVVIRGVAGIREAQPGDLTFLADARYRADLATSQASAVLVESPLPLALPQIVVGDPYLAFCRIVEQFVRLPARPLGVSPQAVVGQGVRLGKDISIHSFVVVSDRVTIGDGVTLYPGTYVGEESEVGDGTLIYPNVTIRERVRIGRRCIIHSGAVIGSDGFGFLQRDGRHVKIPQVGTVEIEDDVELGANVTVDRATTSRTVIKRGTKIDNLVHIAHNVIVGEHCILLAQVGISGSSEVGPGVILGGQAGVVDHIMIGEGARVMAQSGILQDVPPGQTVSGMPTIPHRQWLKVQAALPRLPELVRRLRELEARLARLEGRDTGGPPQ